MKNHLIATLLAMSSLQLSADFLVQNDTEINFHGSGLFLYKGAPTLVQLQSVLPRSNVEIEFWTNFNFSPNGYIKFWTGSKEGDYSLKIRIKTEGYWNLLKNAKKYMPTFIISLDNDAKPIINGPKDEKELKEAIEKVKKEATMAVTEQIHEGTQLPHKTGGLCRIAAEYFMEPDEEPNKE